ncbi:AraC family transcriptional regulator [Opitutus sp. ER46]|uniref:AraC family transcriptional regulator n=1 Tax=Opitutus sp. ER46 TaxID=2161864 RepID=UPI001E5905C6|nr:AraC family transcriptional regulator [Opitutus sp. ER46]
MAKIVRPDPSRLLSQQVTGGRYFVLNLAPEPAGALTLVLGGRERCNPDYQMRRTTFPFHVLEYVESGRGSVQLGDRTFPLGPGTVFAYAPTTACEIRTEPNDPMVKYFLALAGRDVRARLRQCGLALDEARPLPAHAEVTSVFEDMVREGNRSGALAQRICGTLLELLLLKIEDTTRLAPQVQEPAREAFLRCKALIDAEAERLGTLNEIAAAAGVEASSVCRWFRRYQGTSPYQYLMRRKMNLAAEHLIENGGLVKEAAQRVGFDDPYHFSRAFKAVHGIAPRNLLRYRPAG